MEEIRKVVVVAFVLLLTFGASSFAEPIQPMKEVFYRVVGVASNDVLNIRAQPTSRSEIIGAFSYNNSLLEVTGREGKWARVNLEENSGWIHSGYIEPVNLPTYSHTNLPNGLKCYGEEPFWTVTLHDGEINVWHQNFVASKNYILSAVENTGKEYLLSGVSKSGDEVAIFIKDEIASSLMAETFFNWSTSLYLDGVEVPNGTGCSL